jgi:hypothetical protein
MNYAETFWMKTILIILNILTNLTIWILPIIGKISFNWRKISFFIAGKMLKETQSTLHAFLESSDGAGGIYDLNNGNALDDDDIDQYLQTKGIIIQKEI